jgi:hypothetical protein
MSEERNLNYHEELKEVLRAAEEEGGVYEGVSTSDVFNYPANMEYDQELTTKLYAELYPLVNGVDYVLTGFDEDTIRHVIHEYAYVYRMNPYPIINALSLIMGEFREHDKTQESNFEDMRTPAMRARAVLEETFCELYPTEYIMRFGEQN